MQSSIRRVLRYSSCFALAVLAMLLPACRHTFSEHSSATLPQSLAFKRAADKGGTNGAAIVKAAQSLVPAQRESLEFLFTHMPEHDLKQLSPSLLIANVTLPKMPWRKRRGVIRCRAPFI